VTDSEVSIISTNNVKRELVKPDGTPTSAGWHAIASALQGLIESKTRAGRGGMQFSYITARQVQDKLDEVVGPGNWSSEYKLLHHDTKKNIVVVECTLTVFGVSKSDVGYNNNPDIEEYIPVIGQDGKPVTDTNTGEVKYRKNPGWETEPFKAAYSDSFKRAAVSYGIGRFLYND
jgi:hypothetical protein